MPQRGVQTIQIKVTLHHQEQKANHILHLLDPAVAVRVTRNPLHQVEVQVQRAIRRRAVQDQAVAQVEREALVAVEVVEAGVKDNEIL
jgi:hypothetical protein